VHRRLIAEPVQSASAMCYSRIYTSGYRVICLSVYRTESDVLTDTYTYFLVTFVHRIALIFLFLLLFCVVHGLCLPSRQVFSIGTVAAYSAKYTALVAYKMLELF